MVPNAGSFFKNPVVSTEVYEQLRGKFPDIVSFSVPSGYKLAAAWLIENAGWKRKSIGGVKVHHTQALVIVNPARRSGHDVLRFARAIQRDILQKYGVTLEIEPRVH